MKNIFKDLFLEPFFAQFMLWFFPKLGATIGISTAIIMYNRPMHLYASWRCDCEGTPKTSRQYDTEELKGAFDLALLDI